MAPTQAFEAVNRYLGWGEPNGGIWFVGLEEAGGWAGKSVEEILDYYKGNEYSSLDKTVEDWSRYGHSGKQIRDITCKIVQPLSKAGKELSWKEYRDKYLWTQGYGLFQANLFPIGKPKRKSWHSDFKQLFGFSEADRGQYQQYVEMTRHKRLREFWLSGKPQAVVCFGKEGWPYCENIFQPNSEKTEIIPNKVYSYSRERLILAPFFAYGWVKDEDAKKISCILSEWGVSIP